MNAFIALLLIIIGFFVLMILFFKSLSKNCTNQLWDKYPFKSGDIVRVKTCEEKMMFYGYNGGGAACCTHLDGTNQWSPFDPRTLELVND
jgi:uncharacterized protein YodC (DUF2158 family)